MNYFLTLLRASITISNTITHFPHLPLVLEKQFDVWHGPSLSDYYLLLVLFVLVSHIIFSTSRSQLKF